MTSSQVQENCNLSFLPVARESAKTLTAAQIDSFNERGYYFPLTLLSGKEVESTRAYFDHLFELLKAEGETDSYALLGSHTRCPGLYDLAMNTYILDVVQDIIGPDIICWSSHIFCKTAHDPKSVPFHQDVSYWSLSPSRTVSVWLAVDDCDRENSCMQFIPGTHKKGHLKWSKATGDVVLDKKTDQPDIFGEPEWIEMHAGQFSIHSDLLVHGSAPNTSDRRRCGYTMRFCPPSVTPLTAAWGGNAILCRGNDSTGHWTHHQRPDRDDASSWASNLMRKLKGRVRESALQGDNSGA